MDSNFNSTFNSSNNTHITNNSTDPPFTPEAVKVMRVIFIVIYTIILIFGVAGNILTIIVLSSKKLNTTSTSFYLSALAFVDLLYLVVTLSSKLIDFFLYPKGIRTYHEILCRISPMTHYLLTYFSCWLLVAVTMDRMIWVVLPFQAKKICTRFLAQVITVVIGILAFGATVQFLFTMKIIETKGYPACVPEKIIQRFLTYADLLLAMAGPFVIMLAANTAIIVKMGRIRHTRMTNLRKNSNRTEDKTHSLTTMLLCVSFFFMATTAPLLTYDIVYVTVIAKITPDHTTGSILYGVEQVCYVFWYLNYAVHFLLYCLSGPRFREEAKRLFGMASTSYVNGSQKGRSRTYQSVVATEL